MLVAVVGRGVIGVVWRAHEEKPDREVALKFLPEDVRNDAKAVRESDYQTRRRASATGVGSSGSRISPCRWRGKRRSTSPARGFEPNHLAKSGLMQAGESHKGGY